MEPVIELDGVRVFRGDCREVLRGLPDNSIDTIVTDPPYGLSNTSSDLVAKTMVRWVSGERDFIPDGKGFMGKDWDAFVPPPAVWDECLRVLKPGGHLLAFFGSRTMDLGQLSIRLAGFEIRDNIAWLYGAGFPKSLDVSKAIDKKLGAEREVIGQRPGKASQTGITVGSIGGGESGGYGHGPIVDETAPATPEAQKWQGWGTALKPAFEPIVVARKPLSGTVAETVLEWGTGGLNIDGSRIRRASDDVSTAGNRTATFGTQDTQSGGDGSGGWSQNDAGRWPANVMLDEYTAQLLDEQSGVSKPKPGRTGRKGGNGGALGEFAGSSPDAIGVWPDDVGGGASRFFYVAKASKRDRNEGLEDLEAVVKNDGRDESLDSARMPHNRSNNPKQNFHPTVKPTALMRHLVKLVTPPGGTVLDPFTGSGSTGKAALLEGFEFVGVELTEDYLPIIEGRLKWALENREEGTLF